MKFLIDECISRSVFYFLKDSFDTTYVQDIIPAASDNELLAMALREDRIIITRDKDFGEMVFRDKKQHVGIILLRLTIKHPTNQVTTLKKVLDTYFGQITGNFVIATDSSIKLINLMSH